MARRGVGSNQYADKASNATVEEIEGVRSLSSAVGVTPALSSSSWMAYTQLESAYEDSLRQLLSASHIKGASSKNAKSLSVAQDRVLRSHPDALGLAALKSARHCTQASVTGEDNPYQQQCDVIRSSLQGEHVDDADLGDAIKDLTGIGKDADFGQSIPSYIALSGNAGSMSIQDRASKIDALRKKMAQLRIKALTSR